MTIASQIETSSGVRGRARGEEGRWRVGGLGENKRSICGGTETHMKRGVKMGEIAKKGGRAPGRGKKQTTRKVGCLNEEHSRNSGRGNVGALENRKSSPKKHQRSAAA